MHPNLTQSPPRPLLGVQAILLAVLSLLAYWGLWNNEFITFDDALYITNNPHVLSGLTSESVAWAFSSTTTTYWHPLTWLSHMLDVESFGGTPPGTHMVSMAIHALNAILLHLLLAKATGRPWPALFAALLFALHPINVDSVAWAAERKNVLSSLFFLLTLIAYLEYVQLRSRTRYVLAVSFMVMGLMCKPSVVVAPCVMLLLDWWPLNRFRPSGDITTLKRFHWRKAWLLAAEKLPFVIPALVVALLVTSTVPTFHSSTMEVAPLLRLENAIVGYARYLGLFLWPTDLSILYPFPMSIPWWQPVAAGALGLVLTLLAVRLRHACPAILVGWLWFAGTLAPVSGILRIGLWPAIADRFAYLPFMGLYLAVAWGGWTLIRHRAALQPLAAAMAVCWLAVLLVLTNTHVKNYKDTVTVFSHAVESGFPSATGYTNMGLALMDRQQYHKAIDAFQRALKINPDMPQPLSNLGVAEARLGNFEAAERFYMETLARHPRQHKTLNNLALLRIRQGRREEARELLEKALEAEPETPSTLANMASQMMYLRRYDEAVRLLQRALKVDPYLAEAHYNLGLSLNAQGHHDKAMIHIQRTLDLVSRSPELMLHICRMLTDGGLLEESLTLCRMAVQYFPGLARTHAELGRVLLESGRNIEAEAALRRALELQPDLVGAKANLERLSQAASAPTPP